MSRFAQDDKVAGSGINVKSGAAASVVPTSRKGREKWGTLV
jgi:hypothetical protein